ncbi:MAG TPA: Gfo/Idh/MocA family oxidoreductase [Vicinamibacterales bacterium]|nr:Gfo/Idh/MocA family oxidoreductase [Vicinamibacterales bacterium]
MTTRNETTRREFIRRIGAGAVAAGAAGTVSGLEAARPLPRPRQGRIVGANDRINIGFVGCGGRMNAHIRRIMERSKERGDVQAVAVNDIWDKRKQRAREATGVDERSVHHDYRELCARPDVDVVVISSPDHWHYLHAMEALRSGKDVYLEKPMTYTLDEAKEIAETVQAGGRILQVGSQYTSMDHFWKARKAIQDGLLGEVVWASGGFGRNRNLRGEWNYAIDPDANPKTLDWKAFLGPAPKRPFDPERYFRWRKYWDYSGGIATDLFYHTVSPLLLSIGGDFPLRVTSSGGIYVQKDREVPDTFFMNVDYPSWTMQLACSVGSGVGAPLVIHGSQATLFIGQNSENLGNTTMELVPDQEYRDEFVKKTGVESMMIDVQPALRGTHPHMDNFLECVRSRQEPNLPPRLGYQAMAAIAMGVQAYRQHEVLFFDRHREKAVNQEPRA